MRGIRMRRTTSSQTWPMIGCEGKNTERLSDYGTRMLKEIQKPGLKYYIGLVLDNQESLYTLSASALIFLAGTGVRLFSAEYVRTMGFGWDLSKGNKRDNPGSPQERASKNLTQT